jgi:hypothetical protein
MCVSYLCEIVAREKLKVKPVVDIQSAATLPNAFPDTRIGEDVSPWRFPDAHERSISPSRSGKQDSSNIAARLQNTELDSVFMAAPRTLVPLLFGYRDVGLRGKDDASSSPRTTCGRPKT